MRPNPPLCIECGKGEVRRYLHAWPPKRGFRIIDGIKWSWFCSRVCTGRAMGCTYKKGLSLAGTRALQAKARARMLARLVTACKAVMDANQLVPVQAMVKVMALELRRERAAGYTAALARHRITKERIAS